MIKAGVIGATGYAGQQLVYLLKYHKEVEIIFLSSNSYSGKKYSDVYTNYYGIIDNVLVSTEEALEKYDEIDVLFLALPHGKSIELVKKAVDKGVKVIDLGADYRLDSKEEFEKWYQIEHPYESLLKESEYALVELKDKESIKNSKVIANPGCYPTATLLGIAPLLKKKFIDTKNIIVDAKSGISGAGRGIDIYKLYCEATENVKAYKVASHRHTAEIEQEMSKLANKDIKITFTPTLIPMSRGILSTIYANLKINKTKQELLEIYKEFYKENKFVRIREIDVQTKDVKRTNYCDITINIDNRTNRVIITSVIDNIVKGAAGQAIQNMNVLFDLEENMGIENISIYI
ncbi:N-acetyl-gamma-glutamyl-phosphate reductase [Hypnocyclicus thermotrophus]|uniref:N-acetyl-gamma-glutamyl-phosphate reductase n=1 Tax=Hypnocyclicus thermotrophus TaxID=1627895 RepID=A0AA46DYZ2_9FUSO|nr:N-acetyl-gamma-glutamyl-phosphate reductase [Hypnocyclicus thermotrophus]TDT70634.1 N-acetyl-gamma-glutamyl-phosphate reductase [Hypnocyclicus thermotrophus]